LYTNVHTQHAMMRSSARRGIVDAKHECVGPWAFYGPSLPEFFCRCKMKVRFFDQPPSAAAAGSEAEGPKVVHGDELEAGAAPVDGEVANGDGEEKEEAGTPQNAAGDE
jgi:hypothetical protein